MWLGTLTGHGTPLYNYNRDIRIQLRRLVYEMCVQSPNNRKILLRCGNKTCLNPDHMSGLSYSKFFSEIASVKPNIDARIKMQRAKRQNSKLNIDIARQIRMDYRLAKDIASDYGVTVSTVRDIKKNKMYVDYQNPWSQLL